MSTENKPNINELILNIQEQFKENGWDKILKDCISKHELTKIVNGLFKLKEDDRYFTPKFKIIFQMFNYCKLDDLRLVILGDIPEKYIDCSNGMLFSHFSNVRMNDNNKFLHALTSYNKTYGTKSITSNLYYLANQGVLLLPRALTIDIDGSYSNYHYELWKNFVVEVILRLSNKVPFLLVGGACKYKDLIKNKIYVEDMIDNEYKLQIFDKLNEMIIKNNMKPIKWIKN